MKKRLLCLLLTLCLFVQLLPMSALAEELTGAAENSAAETAVSADTGFADVGESDWYFQEVMQAVEAGYFSGVSDTEFAPEGSMTRAMFVTVLGRMAGVNTDQYADASAFEDVQVGDWYAPYVAWACHYGLTSGIGDGLFDPDGIITRQEVATLLVRYFETFDISVSAGNVTDTTPADYDAVSDWAKESVLQLWQNGILQGTGAGSFEPQRSMTRAEVAALCVRLNQNVTGWKAEDSDSEAKWTPVGTVAFTDVSESDWFYSAVCQVVEAGYFNGVSDTEFAPERSMTRAMFVTVLGRMAGVNSEDYADRAVFEDVASDAWYAPYVAWAAHYGITTGVSDTLFDPDGIVTRQQVATLLVRYCDIFEIALPEDTAAASRPADFDDTADWAKDSVLRLWRSGILQGTGDGNVEPQRTLTRAEAATLCTRLDSGEVRATYTVTFNDTDRTTVLAAVTAEKGAGLADTSVPSYPDADNADFLGWFYYSGEDLYHYDHLYPYNRDLMVFALCGTEDGSEQYLEDQYYVVEDPVPTSYSVCIRPTTEGTKLNPAADIVIYASNNTQAVTYNAIRQSNGDYVVTVAGADEGVNYCMVISENFDFVLPCEDNPDETALLDHEVRYITYKTEKAIDGDLEFRKDIVWIAESDFDQKYTPVEENTGKERELDDQTTALGTGTFTIPAAQAGTYSVENGSVVCVYDDQTMELTTEDGEQLSVQRQAPYLRDYTEESYQNQGYTYMDLYQDEDTAYYLITDISSQDSNVTYSYRELDNSEIDLVLYVPDVIPYQVEKLPTKTIGTTGTIQNYLLYDEEIYSSYSENMTPDPCEGDIVVLYTDEVLYYGDDELEQMRLTGRISSLPYLYGLITAVDDESRSLTYEVISDDEVEERLNALDSFNVERYIPESMLPVMTDAQEADFEDEALEALDDPEFLKSFVFTAIQEDADNGSEEAETALSVLEEADDSAFTLSGGNGKAPDDSKKVEITGRNLKVNDSKTLKYLVNSDGTDHTNAWRISMDLGMMLVVKLKLNETSNMYYVISGNFTQEFSVGVNAGGKFSIKWKFIIPVPKEISFHVSLDAETATDLTLDIRHYVVSSDESADMLASDTIFDQKSEQTVWTSNFQEFLLSDEFVTLGAGLYALEAQYETAVADALELPAGSERDAAEANAKKLAGKINTYWNTMGATNENPDPKSSSNPGTLANAWNRCYHLDSKTTELADQTSADNAKKAADGAKDALVSNLVDYTENMNFIESLTKTVTDTITSEAEKTLRGLHELDSSVPDNLKDAEAAMEDVQAAGEEAEKSNDEIEAAAESDDKSGYSATLLGAAQDTIKFLNQVALKIQLVSDAIDVAKSQGLDADVAKELQGHVTTIKNAATTGMKALKAMVNLYQSINALLALSDTDNDTIPAIYEALKDLNTNLADAKAIMSDLKTNYLKDNATAVSRLSTGIEVTDKVLTYTNTALDLYKTVSDWIGNVYDENGSVIYNNTTDGIQGIPTETTFWVFRNSRLGNFNEFSLNTEIVKNLNSPDDGLNDDNIKALADKYSEMCSITNTWMDIYRLPLANADISIFPGLDVNAGVDFVVQANINIAANFNFHLEYGKEFTMTVDVLHWKVYTTAVDRTNQQLSVRLIAMGTLGMRAGFEFHIGLKIIKIFKVTFDFEVMPYINIYGYVFFEYTKDLKPGGQSTTKLKGALYIDVGVHFGIKMTLTMDIWVYKNTWRFSLWNKDITLFDIGDRYNAYNFAYSQPSPLLLSCYQDDEIQKIRDGDTSGQSQIQTDVNGLLIVNPSTSYQLPESARTMSTMNMTDGSLGETVFPASRFKYTFFTVDNDKQEEEDPYYNLPVAYKQVEAAVKDENGDIVYEEQPLDISLRNGKLEVQKVPKTEMVDSDQLTIDLDGISSGKYTVDTGFSVDSNGTIHYSGEGTAQEAYVLIEWKEGSLEFSNYPLRRVVHILWSNQGTVTWQNFNAVIRETDAEIAGTADNPDQQVWGKTRATGTKLRVPSTNDLLNIIDPNGIIYQRYDSTDNSGSSMALPEVFQNLGTTLRVQSNTDQNIIVNAKRRTYELKLRTMNQNGEMCISGSVSAIYGGKFKITEPQNIIEVSTDDGTKYLKFVGYRSMMLNNLSSHTDSQGNIDFTSATAWPMDYTGTVGEAMATELNRDNVLYYLEAVYEDITVQAVFRFRTTSGEDPDGDLHTEVVQTFMRGGTADFNSTELQQAISEVTEKLGGKDVVCTILPVAAPITTNTEYTVDCRVISVDAPTVEQIEDTGEVRLSSNLTPDEERGDSVLYGFSTNSDQLTDVNWMSAGKNTMNVVPNTQYYFFCAYVDGLSGKRTYSTATAFRYEGEQQGSDYTTTVTFSGLDTNPGDEIILTLQPIYDGGVSGEAQQQTIVATDSASFTLSTSFGPEDLTAVQYSVKKKDGSTPTDNYSFYLSISAAKTGSTEEEYTMKQKKLIFKAGTEDAAKVKVALTK